MKLFDIKQILGKGSYGCVLRVSHKKSSDNREYALKVSEISVIFRFSGYQHDKSPKKAITKVLKRSRNPIIFESSKYC